MLVHGAVESKLDARSARERQRRWSRHVTQGRPFLDQTGELSADHFKTPDSSAYHGETREGLSDDQKLMNSYLKVPETFLGLPSRFIHLHESADM